MMYDSVYLIYSPFVLDVMRGNKFTSKKKNSNVHTLTQYTHTHTHRESERGLILSVFIDTLPAVLVLSVGEIWVHC